VWSKIDEGNLLSIVGVHRAQAWDVAKRFCPELPAERSMIAPNRLTTLTV
jgi:hypothetical protein